MVFTNKHKILTKIISVEWI